MLIGRNKQYCLTLKQVVLFNLIINKLESIQLCLIFLVFFCFLFSTDQFFFVKISPKQVLKYNLMQQKSWKEKLCLYFVSFNSWFFFTTERYTSAFVYLFVSQDYIKQAYSEGLI